MLVDLFPIIDSLIDSKRKGKASGSFIEDNREECLVKSKRLCYYVVFPDRFVEWPRSNDSYLWQEIKNKKNLELQERARFIRVQFARASLSGLCRFTLEKGDLKRKKKQISLSLGIFRSSTCNDTKKEREKEQMRGKQQNIFVRD